MPAPALPAGEYRYELRRNGELAATEEETLAAGFIRGVRRTADGFNSHEVEARLDAGGFIVAVECVTAAGRSSAPPATRQPAISFAVILSRPADVKR